MMPNLWPLARTSHRWLQRMTRHETQVDQHRLVWLERGSPRPGRQTVVLIHGFAAMKENWGAWLPLLPRDWHILALDLPGFGESDYRAAASYSYEPQAARLCDWLSGRGLSHIHLVGSSMGGAIATVLAHRLDSGIVRSLTLMNSAGIPEGPDVDVHRPARNHNDRILIPDTLAGACRMFNQVGNGKANPLGVVMAGLLGPDLLKRANAHRHIFADLNADTYAPVRYLENSRIPLQVHWGDRDRITPTACVSYFQRPSMNADIQLYRGVGHLPMLEVPRRSARALKAFIERRAPA